MKLKFYLVVLIIQGFSQIVSARDGLRVDTGAGTVEGLQHGDLRVFLGIPYAQPPLGSLRWKPPLPFPKWTGVRSAKEFGHRAPQGVYYSDQTFRDSGWDEDCLTLNIWTPAASAGEKLPVIVWIHGGALQSGGSSAPGQDGGFLAREGVVVVSINYRLGVFGFLAHPAFVDESPVRGAGNYGLMDQVEALRWVRSNIAAFGGDPECVTLLGESAGSESISALMASPMGAGLFQRAIGESGAMFFSDDNVLNRRAPMDALLMREKFGAETAEQLRAIPAQKLVEAFSMLDERGGHSFGYVVEPQFLPERMEDIYAAGKQNDVPLLAGWNRDEWFVPEANLATLRERAVRMFGALAPEALRYYRADADSEAARAATDLESDVNISWMTWRWLDLHSATAKSPVFRYKFAQPRPVLQGQPERGVYHGAELTYVFGTFDLETDTPWSVEHRTLGVLMRKYWANFARTGNPNGPDLNPWPTYSEKLEWSYLRLDTVISVEKDQERDKYRFLTRTKPIWMRY